MSPVYSLGLDKMSLCGTEKIYQTGGSLGGALLCNVFDDPLDSPGPGASVTDVNDMSLASNHPSDGTVGTSRSSNYDA